MYCKLEASVGCLKLRITHGLGHSQSPALFCTLLPGGPFQPIPPRGPPREGKPPLSPPLPIPLGTKNKFTV